MLVPPKILLPLLLLPCLLLLLPVLIFLLLLPHLLLLWSSGAPLPPSESLVTVSDWGKDPQHHQCSNFPQQCEMLGSWLLIYFNLWNWVLDELCLCFGCKMNLLRYNISALLGRFCKCALIWWFFSAHFCTSKVRPEFGWSFNKVPKQYVTWPKILVNWKWKIKVRNCDIF